MLALLKGIFGTVEEYAFQDLEALPVGPLLDTQTLPGAQETGGCEFEDAQFGGRT